MKVDGAVVVVTGAGGGIGAALAQRFAVAGASAVVVADRHAAAGQAIAEEIGATATAIATDVSDPAAITDLVDSTLERHGRIDLFCSNAGITTDAGLDDPLLWQRAFEINVLAHVHAARAVLPSMLARGRGYLLNTASAAGLLTAPGDAPYTVTKHAAVGLAEWLAITYGGRGIGVSVLCPFGVSTPMLMAPLAAGNKAAQVVAASGTILSPEQVADAVLDGLERETFLILPHPEVGPYWARKASDPDRWLAGIRRLVDTENTANTANTD
jgi:NAD(P)-dependent dehydrogenase (short-subunit alcohol dehydrogenase family)